MHLKSYCFLLLSQLFAQKFGLTIGFLLLSQLFAQKFCLALGFLSVQYILTTLYETTNKMIDGDP